MLNLTEPTLAALSSSSTAVKLEGLRLPKSAALTLTLIEAELPVGNAKLAPALISKSAVLKDRGNETEPGVPSVPVINTVAPVRALPSCASALAWLNR